MPRRTTVSLLLVAASTLVGACSRGPTVDGSSFATCQSSLQAVSKAAASSKDSTAYTAALLRLAGPLAMHSMGTSMGDVFGALNDRARVAVSPPAEDSTVLQGALCDGLQGLRAHEIVFKADSLGPRVTKAFDARYATAYVAKLTAAKHNVAQVRDSLSKFQIESASLTQERGFIGLESHIALTVLNGTSHSISRAFFSADVRSPGREIPWIEETFNYTIPGGLAPGERATWHLTPKMFAGSWNNVQVPSNARFTATVVKLAGPDAEPLWGGAEFTLQDQKRLDSLTRVVTRQ
jgi:hypothetical protein